MGGRSRGIESRHSEIRRFWLLNPKATSADVAAWLGEEVAEKCQCGLAQRRFEQFAGRCNACAIDDLPRNERCGCELDGEPLVEFGGWHFRAPDTKTALDRCPQFWLRQHHETELQKKVQGKTVTKRVGVEFCVDPRDRNKLIRTYRDEGGREINPR